MKVIAAINPLHHVIEIKGNETNGFSLLGVDGRLLKIISDVLKFNLSFVSPIDGEWGTQTSNGSWSGLIGMLQRNEADIAMAFLKISEDYLTVADASTPYMHQPVKFIVGKPKAQSTSVAFLKTFDVAVWIGVGVALLFLLFIFKILFDESFGNTLLQFVGNLLKQPTTIPITSKPRALLLGFWWFSALVISFSYSAAVLSFLSYPMDEKAIRNFEDLSKAVEKGTHRCLTLRGSNLDGVLKSEKNVHLRNLGKTIEQNGWYFNIGERLIEKEFSDAAIMDLKFMLDVNYGYLERDFTSMSMDGLESGFTAMSITKRFCCKNAINTVLSRVQCSGIFDKITRDELVTNWILKSNGTYVKPEAGALTLDDVRGPFLILLGGYTIAIFCLFAERLHYITHALC
ncbi:glutamate receptor ionotropic, kainate glr-3-like [Parasteatoda tepidariorum]|uniref:glutamate receptor ionotropic, kainate glr-3-like n=1 Tax=Parasteatoda tepidariorum TaxID=114398 RepID=UPI00077FE077|nr:glutamate receptor ionotropic, delta-2-like [Parasteatoda tepidariorum]